MNVWTVANQKGGVGKTTTVATLGGLLAAQGKRVCLIDCDPHASLTSYFGFDTDSLDFSLFDVFQSSQVPLQYEDLPKGLVLPTQEERLDFIASSIGLATLEKVTANKSGMGLVVKKLCQTLSQKYDYILLDCPPILGVLLVNALAACQRLIIPVQTEFLALKGLERMMHTINMVVKAQRHRIEYVIVPTMFDRRTKASIATLRNMRDDFGVHLWPKVIPVDTKFRDASQQHRAASAVFPESHGVVAYEKLLQHLLKSERSQQVA